MNEVMDFLAQNYLYVAAGSLVVIIILILIIVLGNKKRMKKENEEIANIGEIKTGSIDDVANNINANNANVMAPQEIGEVTQAIPVVNNEEEAVSPFVNEVPVQTEEPVATSVVPEPIAEPIAQSEPVEEAKVEETPVVEPEPTPVPVEEVSEPVSPIQEEIGIPVIEPMPTQSEPVEIPVIEPEAEVTPTVEAEPTPVAEVSEPVEEPKTEESPVESPAPTPVVEPQKEELEVFGLDDEPTEKSGTAVAGFSSVNVEK